MAGTGTRKKPVRKSQKKSLKKSAKAGAGKKPHVDHQTIKTLDAEWAKAARARDIDRVVSFYAKDGSVAWPGDKAAKGHANIRARWEDAYKQTPELWLDFKPTHIEIAKGGNMAVDFGVVYFAPNAKPDDPQNVAKYLVVWKRENGAWKVLYDCYNMNGAANPVT
jgi:uncharacterized protein (TIGR02246 family)